MQILVPRLIQIKIRLWRILIYTVIMWFTYLLLCNDKSIYTGITNNLGKRLLRHRQGKGGRYTRSRGVSEILYSEKFRTKGRALKREAEIKKWRREKKLKLMSGRPRAKIRSAVFEK